MVYGKIIKDDSGETLSDGFITFVFVDENNKAIPHHMVMGEPVDEEDAKIRERANKLQ